MAMARTLLVCVLLLGAQLARGDEVKKKKNEDKKVEEEKPPVTGPEVETNFGRIRGFLHPLTNGGEARVFLGVPFAKPPKGFLRLEKPIPPLKWNTTLETTKFGPACPPHAASQIIGDTDEDCLYLNVITPKEKSSDDRGYAVLYFVHGGGYEVGAAVIHGYKAFAEKFITRDVIVVTVSYRLGPFGFFSSGDRILPGNLGLWDQAAGLKWTSQNIAAFGGDPSRVTIWGYSAGGGSVSQLSISPIAQEFMAGSIEMSGSAWHNWAINGRIVNNSLALANELGCKQHTPSPKDSQGVKDCLKMKSVAEIHAAVEKLGVTAYDLSMLKFGPHIDGKLVPNTAEETVKVGKPKRAIIGLSSAESAWFTIHGKSKGLCSFGIEREDFKKFGEKQLVDFIKTVVAKKEYFGENADKAAAKIIEKYVEEDKPANADYKFYLERYTKMLSDLQFNVGSLREAQSKLREGWPVYLYLFDHFNPNIIKDDDPFTGSPHTNEYAYLFDVFTLGKFDFKEEDKTVEKTLIEAFINFAKTGNPSTDDVIWPGISQADPFQYLAINGNPEIRENLFKEEVEFWQQLSKEFKYDLIELPAPKPPKTKAKKEEAKKPEKKKEETKKEKKEEL